MKNKKGFTLIELLAVIIILAIIATIAVPMVLDVIDDARISAAKTEAVMIVKSVNQYCELASFKASQDSNFTNPCTDDNGISDKDLKLMVENGNYTSATVTYENGKVTKATIESNGKKVEYDGSVYKIDDKVVETPEPEEPQVTAYYAFGTFETFEDIITNGSMDYNDVKKETGSTVFVKLEGEQLSVCINDELGDGLKCFKNNNFEEENVHLQNVFGVDSCSSGTSFASCTNDDFYCDVDSSGYVECGGYASGRACNVDADGSVVCE